LLLVLLLLLLPALLLLVPVVAAAATPTFCSAWRSSATAVPVTVTVLLLRTLGSDALRRKPPEAEKAGPWCPCCWWWWWLWEWLWVW
jgi:hypothetical protein